MKTVRAETGGLEVESISLKSSTVTQARSYKEHNGRDDDTSDFL